MEGLPPMICGDGEQTRDFIFVRDITEANNIALNPQCTGIFNVGTGNEVSVNFLTQSLLKISQLGISAEHGPQKKGEQRRSSIDSKVFQKSFGWKPYVSLEEGLVETFNYFKDKTD